MQSMNREDWRQPLLIYTTEDTKNHNQKEDNDVEHQETDNIFNYSIEYQTRKAATLQA